LALFLLGIPWDQIEGELLKHRGGRLLEGPVIDGRCARFTWQYMWGSSNDRVSSRFCKRCGRKFAAVASPPFDPLGLGPSVIRLSVCRDCTRERVRKNSVLTSRAYRARNRKKSEPTACAHCGEQFTPKRSDARYCSARCRVAAHRATG
jgi:hypothetical protein